MLGDFNEIVVIYKKLRRTLRLQKQMDNFRSALIHNGLVDLGWEHHKFTWSNRHSEETLTRKRLDRAVANSAWLEVCDENKVEVLTSGASNHLPLLVSAKNKSTKGFKVKRFFRFEAKWTLEEDGEETFDQA